MLSGLSDAQQRLIVIELNETKEINAVEAQKFGLGIKDEMERLLYQQGVYNNKMLKSRRAIAKEFGIKAGDILTVEVHVMFPD